MDNYIAHDVIRI